jgi:chemotaxis protein CheX
MALVDGKQEVAPATKWPEILATSAIEVFSMMVGSTVTLPEREGLPVQANITGMVGIAGAFSAVFSLRCSTQSATKMASQMLGVPVDDAAAQLGDAVGEVCNIVAGDFKSKIGLGDKCMLSVPSVVSGRNYQLHSAHASERLEVPLLYEGEPIWIALDIRK